MGRKIIIEVPEGECCVGCDLLKYDKCLLFKEKLMPKKTEISATTITVDFYKHSKCITSEIDTLSINE
jgi:hypothetical protein